MIARELEQIIQREAAKTHISNHPLNTNGRFESLRGCGLLPKGRVRNSQHLTFKELAAGILSIIAPLEGFAGLTVIVLKGLKPVGGSDASFYGANTFCGALAIILKNENDELSALIKVSVSDSEIYTNGHGRAAIYYKSDGIEKVSYYVGKTAVSLLQPGVDKDYNPAEMINSVATETVIYPNFFSLIVRNLEREAAMPPVVYPEEPETNEELERQKRAEYLGLKPSSRFLNIGVDCQVTWPKEETLVKFDGYKLVLMPKTKEHTTSIHMDLQQNKVTSEEARTIMHQFLSMLAWCNDQYAVAQGGWSGNPVPVPVSKRDLAFSTAHHWGFDRKNPKDDDTRKAIAIYREGRNAEQNFLISYSVLSYYKILEIRYKGKNEVRAWFKENYKLIREGLDKNVVSSFEKDCGSRAVENYLAGLCRSAVAHARDPHTTDPDNYEELSRLHDAARVLRHFARHFIGNELELSDNYFDGS